MVDHFVGPEDPRECVCCGKAMQCVEVDPKDLVLTLQAAQLPVPEEVTRPDLPSPSLAPKGTPGIPPLVIPLPPAIPKIPTA